MKREGAFSSLLKILGVDKGQGLFPVPFGDVKMWWKRKEQANKQKNEKSRGKLYYVFHCLGIWNFMFKTETKQTRSCVVC